MILPILFLEFFKIGIFAFGGGLATIPFLHQFIEKYSWFTEEELTSMIAISEATPGPLGVNMATYVGFKTAGISGAIIASLGIITPSIIISTLIVRYLLKFKNNTKVNFIFNFLHPMVVGLMAAIMVILIGLFIFNFNQFVVSKNIADLFLFKRLLMLSLLLLAFYKFKPYPIFILLISGIYGVFFE